MTTCMPSGRKENEWDCMTSDWLKREHETRAFFTGHSSGCWKHLKMGPLNERNQSTCALFMFSTFSLNIYLKCFALWIFWPPWNKSRNASLKVRDIKFSRKSQRELLRDDLEVVRYPNLTAAAIIHCNTSRSSHISATHRWLLQSMSWETQY